MFLHSHGNLSHTYLDFLSGATISENHGHSGLVGTLKYVIHNNEQQTLGSFWPTELPNFSKPTEARERYLLRAYCVLGILYMILSTAH